MAMNKKLSAEIDRTIKKIQEGIQLFDDIWTKLHNAGTQNLKERFQGELKTEIKKLQRMRDQIKTWQGMSDVRDKRSIDEARRNIEAKMEQFKACEREAKIKTFSKIGLSLPTKEDPEEIAKEQSRAWLKESIDQFNQQIEQAEADLSGARKSKRKNVRSDAEQARERLTQYRYHVTKLEQLLRMLDNEQITPEEIEPLQDVINSYLANNQDPDYDPLEIEGIYEDTVPDDLEDVFPDTPTQPFAVVGAVPPEKKEEPSKPTPVSAAAVAAAAAAAAAKLPQTEKKKKKSDDDSKTSTPTTPSMPTPPSQGLPKVGELPPTASQVAKVGNVPNYAAAAKAGQTTATTVQAAPPTSTKKQPVQSPTQPATAVPRVPTPNERKREPSSPVTPTAVKVGVRGVATAPQPQLPPPQNTPQQSPVPQPVQAAASPSTPTQPQQTHQPQQVQQPVAAQPPASPSGSHGSAHEAPAQPYKPAMSKEQRTNILKMLEQSKGNLPVPEDTRKRSPYVPPNPYKTPSYYPQQPHQAFEHPENFSHFDTDTLFFIFYYQQSTYQQYLAARELKRQSWRFHKRYLTWFQRADPPAVVNDEFEQGSYIFFDFEDGWQQRLRKDFTFKYCFLEDELPTSS